MAPAVNKWWYLLQVLYIWRLPLVDAVRMSVTTFAVLTPAGWGEGRKAKTLQIFLLNQYISVQDNLFLSNSNLHTSFNTPLAGLALWYVFSRLDSFASMMSKFRTFLTISWKLCPNVAIYELCGGVDSIFTYYFGKNRRMKTLPTAVATYDQKNRIVWRWVNISPKPFQPGKKNVNVHPSTAATASAGAFNTSLWLIVPLDRMRRVAIYCMCNSCRTLSH